MTERKEKRKRSVSGSDMKRRLDATPMPEVVELGG